MENDLLIQKILIDNGYSPNLAKLFAAVSRHETGNYTSNVLKSANNLFGMKFPRIRTTNAKHEDRSGYAVYDSRADSVRDLVFYLDAREYPDNFPTARALVSFMKSKGYFEADLSEYIAGVERALPKVETL